MSKFAKRMVTMALAVTVMVSAAASTFAASSPTGGNTPTTPTTPAVTTPASNDLTVNAKKVIKNSFSAVTEKYDTVTLVLYQRNKVKKNVLKGNGKNTTKVIITKAKDAKKLKAEKFNAKAFKGYKGNIVVKKSAMSKKQYKLLKAKLKKGGFKGKISYED